MEVAHPGHLPPRPARKLLLSDTCSGLFVLRSYVRPLRIYALNYLCFDLSLTTCFRHFLLASEAVTSLRDLSRVRLTIRRTMRTAVNEFSYSEKSPFLPGHEEVLLGELDKPSLKTLQGALERLCERFLVVLAHRRLHL